MPELNAAAIAGVPNRHGVRYVVIGGIAAQLRNLPVPATIDIDITPARDQRNLERLSRAFDDLEAGLLTVDEAGTWFPRKPVDHWAQYDTLHLMTIFGPIDIVFTPDGASAGYADLHLTSSPASLGDERVMVISVATWESLKLATGRAKDLEHLDRYYEARKLDE